MMEIEKLIDQLRTESLYKDKATLEIMDLCMEAALALEQLQAENEKLKAQVPRWIPVEERLPEGDEQVLVFSLDEYLGTTQHELAKRRFCVRTGWNWYVYSDELEGWISTYNRVTHWMPLPKAPKEG